MKSPARRSYKRPPITEAVIDVQYNGTLSEVDAKKIIAKLAKEYPQTIDGREVEVTINESKVTSSDVKWNNFRLLGKDGADLVIVSKGGISTNRLAPYLGWEQLEERARNNYVLFRATMGVLPIKRVGVRFINRIDIPIKMGSEFQVNAIFRTYPQIPAEVAQKVVSYGERYELLLEGPSFRAILTTGTTSPVIADHTSFLLDIDVIRLDDIPSKPDEFWALIGTMRKYKNAIFEACVTDELRERFDRE